MNTNPRRDLKLDITSLILLTGLLIVPFTTKDSFYQSLTQQIAIGITAAMGIYVMLRMGLLAFTVPAFMAFGGYAAAMLAKTGTTNIVLLMAISVVVPALIAIPLGAVVLRLKGIYFVFVTFIFNEILQILIFETPDLTGGSNGISDVPPASFFGIDLTGSTAFVLVTSVTCIVACLITFFVTHRFRAEFSSIDENETLTESLGVAIWKYRTIGFVISAGVSGLAGFALVNMLSTAHPSSFASWSVNNYIAYVFIGGRGSMLGVVVGSVVLIILSTLSSSYAQLSAGVYGLMLIVVMMLAPMGLVGTCVKHLESFKRRCTPRKLTEVHVVGEHK